mgnify:CR=1 FL=1|tara:strand:+ start:1395 stop:1802 length:408 start_codon:yes stop_codon:yes gene_type:complete
MAILPRINKCPCCHTLNINRINGVAFKNEFQSYRDWKIKKIFNCRKCKEEIAIFVDIDHKEKMVWLDYLRCEDIHYNSLQKLQKQKDKYKFGNRKYFDVLSEITKIKNDIYLKKLKLKIKLKMKDKTTMLISHIY